MSFVPDDIKDPAMGFENNPANSDPVSDPCRVGSCRSCELSRRVRSFGGEGQGCLHAERPDGCDELYVHQYATRTRGPWSVGVPVMAAQNALGTVDGYVYAIPICAVFRRNSMPWNGEPIPEPERCSQPKPDGC
jgi:hypothetical protein